MLFLLHFCFLYFGILAGLHAIAFGKGKIVVIFLLALVLHSLKLMYGRLLPDLLWKNGNVDGVNKYLSNLGSQVLLDILVAHALGVQRHAHTCNEWAQPLAQQLHVSFDTRHCCRLFPPFSPC